MPWPRSTVPLPPLSGKTLTVRTAMLDVEIELDGDAGTDQWLEHDVQRHRRRYEFLDWFTRRCHRTGIH